MTPAAGPAAPASAALTRLRAAMRPHHDRIETIVDLMRPGLTLTDYRTFLERSYGFVAACERELDYDAAPAAVELRKRIKLPMLVADLRAAGLTAAQIEALPLAREIPAVSVWPAAFGYCYVIEGSTLGGQVLSRHLASTLSLPPESMTFLRSYDREVGPMWKAMLAALESALASADAEPPITATARDTFEMLGSWHAR